MVNDADENLFTRFIKRNLPIMTIIGVFLAVSKYIYGDGTDPNSVQISVICTIFVIFLLLMFIIDSFSFIIKQTREQFNKPFFQFLLSYPSFIPSIITVFFIGLLTYAISLTTISKYPSEVSIFVIFIEMCVSLFIASVFCLYIILKLNDKLTIAAIFLLSFVSLILFAFFANFDHQTSSQIFNQPIWILLIYYGLFPLILGLFFVSLIKMGVVLQYKE